MKIFFSQSNFSRRDEFLINTKIIKEKNKIYVRKEIAHPSAAKFLKQLNKNQSFIKKNLVNAKMPKIIQTNNHYLDFQYLHFPSLEYLIEDALISNDYVKAESLYLYFLNFINNQPNIEYDFSKNEKFKSIFLKPIKESIGKTNALKSKILDLNLENLLYDTKNHQLFLIDWEWIFDFFIPKDFVIFRSLFYLSAHLQLIIKTLCDKRFPCIEIVKDFFVPKIFWQHYPFLPQNIRLFLIMENNFQNFVLSVPPKYDENIFLDKLNEKTTGIESNLNLPIQKSQESILLTKEVETLRYQLHKIQSSKTYKIWQGYCHIMKKLGLKKD